jgi:hypothetical protein
VLVSEATRSLLDADELAFLCDAGTEVFGAESMRVYEVVTPETFAQRGASVAPAVASK